MLLVGWDSATSRAMHMRTLSILIGLLNDYEKDQKHGSRRPTSRNRDRDLSTGEPLQVGEVGDS